jgi:hypothetical protein
MVVADSLNAGATRPCRTTSPLPASRIVSMACGSSSSGATSKATCTRCPAPVVNSNVRCMRSRAAASCRMSTSLAVFTSVMNAP